MAFQKFTKSEKTEVLTPSQHKAAQEELGRMGHTSAQNLTPDERLALRDRLLDQTS